MSNLWDRALLILLLVSVVLHGLVIMLLPNWYLLLITFFLIIVIFVLCYQSIFKQKIREMTETKKRFDEEVKNHHVMESFLEIKTRELERTKVSMARATKDIFAERDRVEKERAKDAAILANMGEGMLAVGLDGNVVLINPVAQDFLEVKEDEGLGKFIDQVITLYDEGGTIVTQNEQPIVKTLKTAEKINKTFLFIKKDGTKRSISITSTPIKQNDTIIGAIGLLRDITKEREIDRMKTEFISLASHQLRTPLSAIKWFTEMLLDGDAGKLNSEQNDFAKNISDSTERMIDLVNSLLNISRIESGRIIIDPHPTDVKALVESIVQELRVKTEEKKQTLIVSVHEELPKITLDPKLIRQVYLNLLTNAIKYSPEGGEITVFISRKDTEIISQVSDNGYGIPKDQQDKIFQKFFRAQNVAKIETDGTGLGLYLIKAIIESSHGKIWFESEEGKGTSFWFSLPLSGMIAKKGEVSLDS